LIVARSQFEVAAWAYDSLRDVERELGDSSNWSQLRKAVSEAWPDDPAGWLSERSQRRHKHFRFGIRHLVGDETVDVT